MSEKSGVGENWRRFESGKKKREPMALEDQTQNDVVLGWSLIFFKNKNTPKQCRFGVPDFIFIKKTPLKQRCFGLLATKNAILCVDCTPIKTPLSRIKP